MQRSSTMGLGLQNTKAATGYQSSQNPRFAEDIQKHPASKSEAIKQESQLSMLRAGSFLQSAAIDTFHHFSKPELLQMIHNMRL